MRNILRKGSRKLIGNPYFCHTEQMCSILKRIDNQNKFDELRRQFATFTFESQERHVERGALSVRYSFDLDGRYRFRPTLTIPARGFIDWSRLSAREMETLVFHIGMVELISYWKIACPRQVVIRPYSLTKAQTDFWKKLYYNGLGEFLYLNSIDCAEADLMDIASVSGKPFAKVMSQLEERVLIPIGGGKDSVVTLELLRNKLPSRPLIVNPRGATTNCAEIAGFPIDECLVVNRTLDPTMLQLNKEGYLNGHTPFSALLAFIGILCGFGSASRYITLSNESSANESTVIGTNINHQYSKSVEFEADFRRYVAEFINDKIQYFSFLRPLSELQIAMLFSRFEAYHPVFRSCNAGSKTDSWCGSCPKCLFTWLILSPFLSQEKLIRIFGKNLLLDRDMRPVFDELSGVSPVKPFECVGTVEEVCACAQSIKDKSETILENAPEILTPVAELLQRFDAQHFLPETFVQILKHHLYGRVDY